MFDFVLIDRVRQTGTFGGIKRSSALQNGLIAVRIIRIGFSSRFLYGFVELNRRKNLLDSLSAWFEP